MKLLVALFLLPIIGTSQSLFPEDGYVFDDSSIPEVRIYLPQDSLDLILSPLLAESNHEYPATFIFIRNNQKDTIENIGFRLRGNTSRNAEKKSFKVSFNSFVKGQKYHGLEKMNLNGEHNDPSIVRSKLCWDLYKMAGIPGSRSNHVAFYINDEYRGLYINVEHIDEEFIRARFEENNGNLYKCLWPADMHYRGGDPDLYKVPEPWGRQAYELKTNLDEYNYTDLARFIDILNNYSGDDFVCELEDVFEVDRYLRAISMDILTSNWDGPIVNKNNFYLYNDPCSGKFTYLPYDLDNTMGIDWFSVDWPNTSIYNWDQVSGEYRPLFESIMNIEKYRNKFGYYMNKFIQDFFNNTYLDPVLDQFMNDLTSYRMNDGYAELDYGFTMEDFVNSYSQLEVDHVKYGLKDYISERVSSAENQLNNLPVMPHLIDHDINWNPDSIQFNFAFQSPSSDVSNVSFHFINSQGIEEEIQLNDSGNFNYLYTHQVSTEGKLQYYISATLNNGFNERFPPCDYFIQNLGYQSTPLLVINEFMASNQSGIQDESGAYVDWIEIYNAGTSATPLWDLYLTDDPGDPNKWPLPSEVLNADDYIVIYADNDEEQGIYHANFKLKKEGEFIGIFDNKSNHYKALDSLTFGPQETDISSARIPNGSGPFITPMYITPGGNNEEVLNTDSPDLNSTFIYPNPTARSIFIKGYSGPVKLFNSAGQLVINKDINGFLNLESLDAGLYIIQYKSGADWVTKKLIKL